MKKFFQIVLCCAIYFSTGCLSPLTDRLDALNTELARVNAQLSDTNQQLQKANNKLDSIEISTRRMAGGQQ